MMFVESQNEHNYLFHIAQWMNSDLFLGGSDQTTEDTWLWEDGTASPAEFGVDNSNPINGLPTFWNNPGQPNNAGEQDYVFYYRSQQNWHDNRDGQNADDLQRTVLEVESDGANKFTLPLTNLQEGTVSIAFTGLNDRAGNSLADATVHSLSLIHI